MRLHYFKDPHGNFGDDLNPWLWEKFLPGCFCDSDDEVFVGVGTLINHRLPLDKKLVIFGSGVGYGPPPTPPSKWDIRFVRGPLSASKLNLDEDRYITDPAILVPLALNQSVEKRHAISFMPHCTSASLGDWEQVCTIADVNFIDPRLNYLDVFKEIEQSELLISEAMHGAIVADAMRVPWIPVRAYAHISLFKWQDWAQSMEMDIAMNPLQPVWRGEHHLRPMRRCKIKLKRIFERSGIWRDAWEKPFPRKSTWCELEMAAVSIRELGENGAAYLSEDAVHKSKIERVLEELEKFKLDQNRK